MIVILGYDGLEYNLVKEFNLKNLMQTTFGKTDISEFSQPRTMVIWSSFLAGKNVEERVLSLGKNFWKFKLKPEETFFSVFESWKAIDVPGFTYKVDKHQKEKELLKKYFENEISIEKFDRYCFELHKENKKEFFHSLEKGYEMLMGYFDLADIIGHLSFGIKSKMKIIYEELDALTEQVLETVSTDSIVLVISDHGMKAIGRYGDHSNHGFFSINKRVALKKPKVTQFRKLIESWKTEPSY